MASLAPCYTSLLTSRVSRSSPHAPIRFFVETSKNAYAGHQPTRPVTNATAPITRQAHRLADQVAFLNASHLVEVGATDAIFSEHSADRMTFDYVRGHFG